MSCNGNELSDERIGEALIKEVIQEELREENVPPPLLQLAELPSQPEQKLVNQLAKMIRIVGDKVRDDREFQDSIDGMIDSPGTMREKFCNLIAKVFEHGQITWEKIVVLFYVAGRMAVKVLAAQLPTLVVDIFKLTVNYFKTKLLGWVHCHGGWINSISDLCALQDVPLSSKTAGMALIFCVGLALGSIVTWKLARMT